MTIRENYFYVDGQLWFWSGLTAFLLLKRYLTGREADAHAYMDWALSIDVNLLRVFSQVSWTGPPNSGVEEGFYAKDFQQYDAVTHRLFDAAAARGLRIEFVAHTFTQSDAEMRAHFERCDALVSAHANAVLEESNEPGRNAIPFLGQASRSLAASGQYDPTPYPGRSWCNDHPPRDDEFCRKFKGAWEAWEGSGPYAPFSPPWKAPYVFDEPERIERVGDADDWRAFAAGCRLFGAGVTIHGGEWAQACEVPTDPEILKRISAHQHGIADVPPQRYFDYDHPDDAGSLRRYRRRGEDGIWYEISVRPYAFGPV